MFILVYQVLKVIFHLKVKRWLQLSSCGMTGDTPTVVAYQRPDASIHKLLCLPGMLVIFTGSVLSLPATISPPSLSIPHGDWCCQTAGRQRKQYGPTWIDHLPLPNPPVPVFWRESIWGVMPFNCLSKWWCEKAGIISRIWPVPNIQFSNWAVTCHLNHRCGSASGWQSRFVSDDWLLITILSSTISTIIYLIAS